MLSIQSIQRTDHIRYIQPGKPCTEWIREKVQWTLQGEVLDAYLLGSLPELKLLTEEWLEVYNDKHPNESLRDMSPREYLESC